MSSNANNNFILASRRGIRFPSAKGELRVDDLWRIPLSGAGATIESIGAALLARQQEQKGGSILRRPTRTQASEDLDLAVAIIQYIADVRQEEDDAAALAHSRRQEAQRLAQIIEEREVREAPLDELRERAKRLAAG